MKWGQAAAKLEAAMKGNKMTDAQAVRVVDEMMDRMFGEIEREEREIERLMQEQAQVREFPNTTNNKN